jgi:AraC-like DNA-binding protein
LIYTCPIFFATNPCPVPIISLIDAMPGVIFFALDSQGHIVAANSAMLENSGKTADTLLGSKAQDGVRSESDRSVFKRTEFIRGGQGRAGWFCTTLSPICDTQGAVLGTAGVRYRVSMPPNITEPFARLAPAIRHLEAYFHTKVRMSELADLCEFSVVQFTRVFTTAFALPPKRFLINLRVERAQKLLATTSNSISAISTDTGFFDQSHFTRLFRQITHVTPLAYRKRFSP